MEGKTLELIYMPIRGRAESIRLLLSAAGVAFTDTAAGKDTLPELRQTSVLKSMTGLPVLKVHDATGGGPPIEVPQSYAILRFLARICNVDGKPLLPTDPMQAARADFVAETLLDWRLQAFNPLAFKPGFLSNRQAVQAYFDERLEPILDTFEALIGEAPFFAADQLTYADIVIWETIDRHVDLAPTVLAKHPRLAAFYERTKTATPTLAAYLASRRGLEPHFAKLVAGGTIVPSFAAVAVAEDVQAH